MGVLATTLRRHIRDGPFENLQKRLLHAFARHIARDGGILIFAPYLIDLIDVDNSLLAALDIPVRVLQQSEDDILYILADIARLREGGRVDDSERNIQYPRKCLREKRFPSARRADQQNVRFGELDLGTALLIE